MIPQKDRIEAAIRHIQTAADVDPWAMELAVDALKAQGTCEDAVSRQTLQKELALYPIDDVTSEDEAGYNRAINDVQKMVLHLPSVQPEITDGQAIEHLQASGWMQNHDRQMYEMGLREQLADDSDSYDALLPSAQPEPHYDEWCTDCKEYDHERHCCPRWNRVIRETLKDAQPNTDHIYAELSKVYNVKGLPDEAIGIIGDLMLSLDGPSAQPEPLESLKRAAESEQKVTESDLISRKAAIEALGHMMDTDGFRDGWAVSRANVDCMLRSLPSAQPEIIRCNDCKWWNHNTDLTYCDRFGTVWVGTDPDDFCSFAERETDESD